MTHAASHLLWHDTGCLERRGRKSAAALVAVQQSLKRHRPLAGQEGEFLDVYAGVEAADPAVFSKVWRDPRAYLWARVAHEFVGACIAGTPLSELAQRYIAAVGARDVREALAWHLDQFKMFALAVAFHAGRDLHFQNAWQPPLPFAIPATPWSITGSAPLAITGLVNRRLQIVTAEGVQLVALDSPAGLSAPGLECRQCPVIHHAGCEIFVQPHAFNVPALRDITSAVSAGIDLQWQHYELIIKTLQIIERYDPATFAQFRGAVSLIALRIRPENGTANTSHSQLPGAFMVSVASNPLTLAQDCIHEFCHNRLFAIEEQGAFFDSRRCNAHTDARFYSPWRSDPRPLHGILHAVYVFTCLGRYWLNVHRDQDIRGADRDFVTQRLIRVWAQLKFGVESLQQNAVFTELGQTIFNGLLDDLAELRDDMAAGRLPEDAPALTVMPDGSYARRRSLIDGRPLSAVDMVLEHRQMYEQQSRRNAA
jgi:HEXXH motif-containing protein